jgi:thiamine kinase-like enzyme
MAGELNDIRERLEAELAPLQGEPRELDGGITNRNFRVTLGGEEYVVRRPGKDTELLGIDRSAELLANQAAASIGIAPAVAAVVDGCLVTSFVACRALEQREVASAVEEIARALRAFHDSGVRLPARFWVPELLEDYAAIAEARGARLPGGYDAARGVAARIAAALPLHEPRPCHNDLLAGNLIRADDGGRILLVDWEYAGMGDARFDLGNLSVNNGFDEASDSRLLHAYYGAEPSASQTAALQLMRVLSDAREAAWGVVQGQISELDFDFASYADKHFERLRQAVAQPGFEECLASAGA